MWEYKKEIGYGITILIALVVIGWGLQAAGIVNMNIRREVVQHSQGYTETKVSLLYDLHNDWLQLNTEIMETENSSIKSAKKAQQKSIVKQMIDEANKIPKEVPTEIETFIKNQTGRR